MPDLKETLQFLRHGGQRRGFSAAEIARALGRKRQAVARQLQGVKPSDRIEIRGNVTAVWQFDCLPEAMKNALADESRRRGYDSPVRLLSVPPVRWEPERPLSQIAETYLAKARKLQSALEFALSRLEKLPFSEVLQQARSDYRRAFGKEVSESHLRSLVDRTIERDRGFGEWDRLAIYLDSRAKPVKKRNRTKFEINIGEVSAALALIENPTNPTAVEKSMVWSEIFCLLETWSEGAPPHCVKAAIVSYLAKVAPWMGKTESALERQFSRKYKRWSENGKSVTALRDRRPARAGRPITFSISEELAGKIMARALVNRGRLGQAWRELWDEAELPEEIYALGERGRVPQSIREALGPDIKAMLPHYQGPRNGKVKGPKVVRDWSGVKAGMRAESDDVTFNHYFWFPDPNGEYNYRGMRFRLTRGQVLGWIDPRVSYIHCFQLIPREQYSSLDILRGVIHLHDTWGLPPELYFELGIWRRSLVIQGRKDELGLKDRVYGLRDLGVKVSHAHGPSAKIIEGIFGHLQNSMDKERGFAGRNERSDMPEATKIALQLVRAGKVHPAEYFYSHEEWVEKLSRIMDEYNDRPQEGRTEGMSPREAFVKFQMDGPPVRLEGPLRYLLALHRREVRVSPIGLRIQIGKNKYYYRSAELSALIHRKVLVWFDMENPDEVTVTTLDHKSPFVVGRVTEVPAIDAPKEKLSAARKEIAAQSQAPRRMLSNLKKIHSVEFANRGRRKLDLSHPATREAADLGTAIEKVQEDARQKKKTKAVNRERLAGLNSRGSFFIPSSGEATERQIESAERLERLRKRREQTKR